MSDRSLKSQNLKWLVMLAVFDMFVVLLCTAPELVDLKSVSNFAIARALGISVLPVVVLLLVELLPPSTKAILVYWKLKHPLPGAQAFSRYAGDPRIDMDALKKNVGTFPTEPGEQNTRWYKLYKLVANDQSVVEAHKNYLMYRDMATISIALLVIVPIGLLLTVTALTTIWIVAGFFFSQYLLCAINGKISGIRMVRNVLSAHGSKKITGSKAA